MSAIIDPLNSILCISWRETESLILASFYILTTERTGVTNLTKALISLQTKNLQLPKSIVKCILHFSKVDE